jgi:hypothetical protein
VAASSRRPVPPKLFLGSASRKRSAILTTERASEGMRAASTHAKLVYHELLAEVDTMIRRLILLSLAVYAVVALSKANAKRTTKSQNDAQSHADWESEGGNLPPESVDESLTA